MDELSEIEKRRIRARARYLRNKEAILAKQKARRGAGDDYHRRYYYSHRPEIIARAKDHYTANQDALKARARQRRVENRDEINRKSKEAKLLHPEKVILTTAKSRAKALGLKFDLELSDIVIPEFCPYLKFKLGSRYQTGRPGTSPSIDRVIPELGYVKGNVEIISDLANRMKNNATIAQLKTFADSIKARFG